MAPKTHIKLSRSAFWLLPFLLTILSYPAMAKDPSEGLFKQIKAPSSEWKLRKVDQDELNLDVKDKPKAINIGLKIIENIPISAKTFLDQVRTKGVEDPDTQGAEFSAIETRPMGGLNWEVFVVKRKNEVNQEFWTRSISSDRILMVLYTAVGTYYPQYRPDLMKVLEQAAK